MRSRKHNTLAHLSVADRASLNSFVHLKDAREMLLAKLSEALTYQQSWRWSLERENERHINASDTVQEREQHEIVKRFWQAGLDLAAKDSAKWQRLVDLNLGRKRERKPKYDIETLRHVPLETFLPASQKSRLSNSRLAILCPLHAESSPSFVIYKEQNTFHCFGCGAHGSVFDLVMLLHKLTFKQALRFTAENADI